MAEHTTLGLPEIADLLEQSPGTRDAILVGGQALNVLAVHYGLDAIATAVSYDIDFFGDAATARKAAKAWHGKAKVAGMDDNTANTALVLIEIHGQTHQIDFMSQILGVQAKELKSWAVTVEVDGKEFRVMHPLHVLQSQIENVYGMLDRRSMGPRAAARVMLAMQVVEHVIREYLEADDTRAALKAAERVAEIAVTRAGLRSWHEDAIDLSSAIPPHKKWPPKFIAERLPRLRGRISEKQAVYSRRRAQARSKSMTKDSELK